MSSVGIISQEKKIEKRNLVTVTNRTTPEDTVLECIRDKRASPVSNKIVTRKTNIQQ